MGRKCLLTTQEKAEVIKKYKEGSTMAELATEYKCSTTTIGNAVFMFSRGKGRRKKE